MTITHNRRREIQRKVYLAASTALQKHLVNVGFHWPYNSAIHEDEERTLADQLVWRLIDELNRRGGVER